jgi:hypothetical protein
MSAIASVFEVLQKPEEELKTWLKQYRAEVRSTKLPETSLIKFDASVVGTLTDPLATQFRGLIFNSRTKQVYSATYPVPIEFKDQPEETQEVILKSLAGKGYTVQEALDGTLFRIWYHTETQQWLLSTNNQLDANEAFWMNGCSMAQQFWTSIDGDFVNMNQEHIYLFIMCNPLNVIVVNHAMPQIYHVATYDRATMQEITVDLHSLPTPKVHKMNLEEVILSTIESVSMPVSSAGYMVVQNPDENGVVRRYRFENTNYTQARALRGDSNNVEMILLNHLRKADTTDLQMFIRFYPIYVPIYNQLCSKLEALISRLYQAYCLRYKQHTNLVLPSSHHHLIKDLHTQVYLGQLKAQNATILETHIREFVWKQDPTRISFALTQ